MKKRNRPLILFILSGILILGGLSSIMNINTRSMGIGFLITGIETILAVFMYKSIKATKRSITFEIILGILMIMPILGIPMDTLGEQPTTLIPIIVIIGAYINKSIKYNINIGVKIILYFLVFCGIITIKRGLDSLITRIIETNNLETQQINDGANRDKYMEIEKNIRGK